MIIVPFRGDIPSLHGLFTTIQMTSQLNPQAEVILLPTLIDIRERGTRNVLEEVEKTFPGRVAPAVPKRIAVAEAVEYGKTIREYDGDRLEEVRLAYMHLLNRLLGLSPENIQNEKIAKYERQIEELQSRLSEEYAWRARHDTVTRIDGVEANLSNLWLEVEELSRLLHNINAKVESRKVYLRIVCRCNESDLFRQ